MYKYATLYVYIVYIYIQIYAFFSSGTCSQPLAMPSGNQMPWSSSRTHDSTSEPSNGPQPVSQIGLQANIHRTVEPSPKLKCP